MNNTNGKPWFVYIVECADGTLYTGISNDLDKRIKAHNEGRGAKYTRSRRPVTLKWSLNVGFKGSALIIESHIKQYSREEKKKLIEEQLDF